MRTLAATVGAFLIIGVSNRRRPVPSAPTSASRRMPQNLPHPPDHRA